MGSSVAESLPSKQLTRVRIPARAFKMSEKEKIKKFEKFHDKHYKTLLLIPLIVIILSIIFLMFFYLQNDDFFYKDISLTGGTSVTIYKDINEDDLKSRLSNQLDEINVKKIYDVLTREEKGVIVETKSDGDTTKEVLENYLGYELTEENSSFEFTGPSISGTFHRQLLIAILFAFVFMAIVVFLIFRSLVPSLAVIISAFSNILMTLVVANILGIKMSTAGIVAFLMLIGYSVDTDILLTTRILKRTDADLNKRIHGAFKTGITMTLTSLVAVISALIIVNSFSNVLTQMFTVLAIGLGFDTLNTWITNVSLLKWHVKNKNEK